jgi:hypothetical protein
MEKWYQEVQLAHDVDRLTKRSTAIEQYLNENGSTGAYTFELVRIFFDAPERDARIRDALTKSVLDNDASFRVRTNSREIRLLAGIIACQLIEQTDTIAPLALALAVVCGECQGLRKPLIADAPVIARDALIRTSRSQRSLDTFPVAAFTHSSPNLAKLSGATPENVEMMIKTITELQQNAVTTIKYLSKALCCQQEELNILWWVYSQTSRDMETPFSDLEPAQAGFIAGKELADLTTMSPGPLPIYAFIQLALEHVPAIDERKLTLREIAQCLDHGWKQRLLADLTDVNYVDLAPIHSLILHSTDTNLGDNWISSFAKDNHLQVQPRLKPKQLALQIYYERQLLHNLAQQSN